MDSHAPVIIPGATVTETFVIPASASGTSYLQILSTIFVTPLYYLLLAIYLVIILPLLWILGWILSPLAWVASILLNVASLPYRVYMKFEAIFIFLAIAGVFGAIAGLTVYFVSNFANQILNLDGNDVKSEEVQRPVKRILTAADVGIPLQNSAAHRSVADFRAARRKRKEEELEEEDTSKLRWLPVSGQAHLVPLAKDSKRSVDDKTAMPLTHETILEVDSSTDLDFG